MEELGTSLVLVCSNTQPATLDDDARAAADLREMAERAAKRGMRVGFEALSWGRHVRTWAHAWKIVQMADHPALGLIVDSFHTLALRDDPSGIAELPGERIFFVQLADAPLRSEDVLSWSRHHRSFPLQGELDVLGFTRAVLRSGYSGPLSLEVFNDHFRSAPSRTIARDGLRSLILAEAEAGGATLPAVPEVDGVEFLEFAVDPAARDQLAHLLRQLGFFLAGTHRSKDVQLYRQGGISFVLNSEPDSAASEQFQMHGPSVCAMALRVDDTARALERARALLIPDWRERVGAGEARIPAVRGPDGTLIYLAERGQAFWEEDFELLVDAPGEAGLERVDHLALALPAWQMDTYVLFWRALFGLVPQPVFDLPDPFGLIQSRAMVNASGTLRLTFNISEAQDTVTNRFVSAFHGAGVHHIALGTRDAARSLRALQAEEAPTLADPAELLRGPAGALSAGGRGADGAGGAGDPLRCGGGGRVLPRLYGAVPEPVLLRDRRASGRLRRLRRRQRRRAHGRAGEALRPIMVKGG